jgi:predicted hotdog family 3-hydroxylacyl-ACP dehydratase
MVGVGVSSFLFGLLSVNRRSNCFLRLLAARHRPGMTIELLLGDDGAFGAYMSFICLLFVFMCLSLPWI